MHLCVISVNRIARRARISANFRPYPSLQRPARLVMFAAV